MRGRGASRLSGRGRRSMVVLVAVVISASAIAGVLSGTAGAATCVPSTTTDVYTPPSPSTSGDWSTAANWSLLAPPTGAQVACWNAGTTVMVSVNESVALIQAGGDLSIVGGLLTLAPAGGSSTVGNLALGGGTMTVGTGDTLASGALTLSSGTLQVDGAVTPASTSITGGTLDGTGTVSGTVTNTSGTVSPGDGAPGVLTISGSYSQGGGGTLAIEIGGLAAGSGFGQLLVGGSASLAGQLSLTDVGSFKPSPGNTFQILSFTSHVGTFTLIGPSAHAYVAQYGSTSVTLAVPPPPPPTCPASNFDAFVANGGNWSTPGNWSTGALPTGSQVACWATGTTVTVNSGATAGSIKGGDISIITGGVLNLASSGGSVGNLFLEGGGELDGHGTLTVSGSFDWGGSGGGTAALNKTSSSNLAISQTGGGTLTIGGAPTLGGGSITTTHTIALGSGVDVGGSGGSFTAAGVSATNGSTFGFGKNGLFLTGGTTTVPSGSTLDTGPLTLSGGTLQDNGTVNVTGNYVQNGGATLGIDIGGTTAGSTFGQLIVSGSAALGGNLSLSNSSGFVPGQPDTFKIISSGSARNGALALTGPSATAYVIAYGPNDVTLTVSPRPGSIAAPTITGAGSVGQTLTCSSGKWSANPTGFTYQWDRNGSPTAGATNTTYVVSSTDQGNTLTCTVTASNSFGSTKAVSAGVSIPAPGAGAPSNTGSPTVSGTPTPGNRLSCSNGTWSNNPTGFAYQWRRNGSLISGATGSSYTVHIADEGAELTCTVTASNAAGATPTTSSATVVAEPGTLNCVKPTGKLSGRTLGPFQLGLKRTGARKAVGRYRRVGKNEDDFCLYGGWDIHAGYPSTNLLRTVSGGTRARLRGRIVFALTGNPYYALNGARPGMKLSAVAKRLHIGKVIRVGSNSWYVVQGKSSRGVLRVRGGVIQEVGIAGKAFTNTIGAQRRFLTGFNSA